MQSLQSKLSTGLLLSLIVAFSALWLLVSINVQFLAEEYIASRLKHDAETLLSNVNFDKKNSLTIDILQVGHVYNQPFSGHYFVIGTDNQTISSRSLWDQKLNHQTVNTGQQLQSLQPGPEQQSLLIVSAGYKKQGHQLTITVAEDLNPINENIKQFKYWFAAMAIGMLLTLVMIQIFILRKSLIPLIKIQHELKSLQQGQLEKLSTDVPSELYPLINEVNHLLGLMQQHLLRSRNSLGDLAHAIKKPLTVIKQLTDKHDIPDTSNNILIKQADDIHQITERILKRARLAGHSHSGSLFSFTDDLSALLKTLEMMHTNKALKLTTHIPDNIICPVDREDMMELLGNLLDNAYKWAAQKISLSVSVNSDLYICIEDDGPGADHEKMNELTKRGVRLDEKVSGHGFGLAITADIINDYNGSIKFEQSAELGGFRVNITLPLHH